MNIRKFFSDKDWWKGVFGNILATMIGIVLTVGVAAYVDYRNDQEQAREMMFNVVMACENNMYKVEKYDSVSKMQIASIDTLIYYYNHTNKFTTNVPEDTLQRCLDRVTKCTEMPGTVSSPLGKYFFSAQMMHQFGNPKVYKLFAEFVEMNQSTFEMIEAYNKQTYDMLIPMFTEGMYFDQRGRATLATAIENRQLPQFATKARFCAFSIKAKTYKAYFKLLLKAMGATKEEYETFKKENTTATENDSFHFEENISSGK